LLLYGLMRGLKYQDMQNGMIEFPSIDDTEGRLKTRFIRKMQPEKPFKRGENVKPVEDEAKELEL